MLYVTRHSGAANALHDGLDHRDFWTGERGCGLGVDRWGGSLGLKPTYND